MQISTKLRYGSRVLSELGVAYPEETLSVRELAERQDISEKYLEHIMSSLKSAGIIRSVRGKYGGYQLRRPPEEITLAEVFRVLEGPPAPVECVENPESCSMCGACPTRRTWVDMRDAVVDVLENTTVADLEERNRDAWSSGPGMYHI
ncbi:MAG: RrF2 family transcriptional regulator [Planctomycetota bacterium]